jgi:hypothetical protein
MKFALLTMFGLATFLCTAQTLTHGPIVGGVTDTSCNIFIRTSSATPFTILFSNNIPFGSIVASVAGATDAALDSTAIVHVGGLTPNTRYSMRVTINGQPIAVPTQFSTFYSPGTSGHQVFLTGACINGLTDVDSAIFVQAASEHAEAFIELGNWGYPDVNSCADIYLSNPPSSWAKTYSNVQSLYRQRYASTNSGSFIQSMGLDYIYDDHDYMNEKTGKSLVLNYQDNPFSGIFGAPTTNSQRYRHTIILSKGIKPISHLILYPIHPMASIIAFARAMLNFLFLIPVATAVFNSLRLIRSAVPRIGLMCMIAPATYWGTRKCGGFKIRWVKVRPHGNLL